ncbi:MAG: rRNA (cytosine1962-C5)-methyltransferase [Verrucomicrobiota bacterium]
MQSLPTVLLRPGEADRILAGHPWIYHGSVLRLTNPAADGELVQVKDHRQRFLGVGFYNSKSKINVRVLSPERVEVNEAFFEERIRTALAVRQKHLPKATSFRVVNAESDFLSGLIIDKYEDVLVVQTSSLGMDQRKPMILAVLQKMFSPRAIVERNEVSSRKFEGLPDANGVLMGSLEGPARCQLNGLQFEVDVLGGHKTGLYLDQQVNYRRVGELVPQGLQVLDCFSFLGGFALHAARAGAAQVHLLDQSADAIAAAKRNAEANGLAAQCSFEAVNVFDWLKAQTMTRLHEKLVPRWDMIVLDPPSFTRNRASVPDALRGYKEIHLRALKLLKTGGTLVTFCCSHHVDAGLFQDTVLAAAFDARRILRRVATYSQSPDHPIVPMIPETEYLKGFAFEVVR